MIEQLDKRIAALETELETLRRRKLALLQEQIQEVQASLSPSPCGSSATRKTGRSETSKGRAADLQAGGAWSPEKRRGKPGPKRRGRPPGKRVPDEEILPAITKLVSSSGREGISARKVSDTIGVFYPRVVKIMEANFKRTGQRKWSRYHLK